MDRAHKVSRESGQERVADEAALLRLSYVQKAASRSVADQKSERSLHCAGWKPFTGAGSGSVGTATCDGSRVLKRLDEASWLAIPEFNTGVGNSCIPFDNKKGAGLATGTDASCPIAIAAVVGEKKRPPSHLVLTLGDDRGNC